VLNAADTSSMSSDKAVCGSFSACHFNLITRPASMHLTRNFEFLDRSGSGKLEFVIKRLRELVTPVLGQGRRVVIVVSTDMEVAVTQRVLCSQEIAHISARGTTCPVLCLISMQESVIAFNDLTHVQSASATVIVKDIVFSYPHISPRDVDIVFVLSTSWASPPSVKRCVRAGGSVHRLACADSLEDLMLRKGGSFLHLQGFRIPEVRPAPAIRTAVTFSFDSSKLLGDAPYMLEWLKEMTLPPPARGLGKGKGCFLEGLQSVAPVTDADEDNNETLVEWITKFYFELESAERKMNGLPPQATVQGREMFSMRECTSATASVMLNRYSSLIVHRNAANDKACVSEKIPDDVNGSCAPISSSSTLRVSLQEERLLHLHYKKSSSQSNLLEDYCSILHTFYKEGGLVDSCLYISPLFASLDRHELMMPVKRKRVSADFELQFMTAPPQPPPKAPSRKSRTNTNPNAPKRKFSGGQSDRGNKKTTMNSVHGASSSIADNSLDNSNILAFDSFGTEFQMQLTQLSFWKCLINYFLFHRFGRWLRFIWLGRTGRSRCRRYGP
jgi:hypothetical protein